MAFDHSSLRWFEACSRKPAPRGPPSSSAQPRADLPGQVPHWPQGAFAQGHYRSAAGRRNQVKECIGPGLSVSSPRSVWRALHRDEDRVILLNRGYDAERIHKKIYEDYDIIPVIIRKKTVYPEGFAANGLLLCFWGQRMSRTGIDFARKPTRYACKKVCQRAEQMSFDCPYLDSSPPNRQIPYTRFKDSCRKYGPTVPGSCIYQKLKPMRTVIDRSVGLIKENLYRMETTNTYMGMDALWKRTFLPWAQAETARAHARWVLLVPRFPISKTLSLVAVLTPENLSNQWFIDRWLGVKLI